MTTVDPYDPNHEGRGECFACCLHSTSPESMHTCRTNGSSLGTGSNNSTDYNKGYQECVFVGYFDVCACGGRLFEDGRHCVCSVCVGVRSSYVECPHCTPACSLHETSADDDPMCPDCFHGMNAALGLPKDLMSIVMAMDTAAGIDPAASTVAACRDRSRRASLHRRWTRFVERSV